jgi:galactoside O-acetyltransferase
MKPRYGFLSADAIAGLGFASYGANVLIHELANLVGVERMRIGSHVRIDGFVNLVASAPIRIGDHVHIGSFCHLTSAGGEIVLGDHAGLSQGVYLYTASDDYSGETLTNPTVDPSLARRRTGPVRLGEHVIIGAQSVVLPGVEIDEGASVGACSFVNRSLPAWGVYAGVPVRRLRDRSRNLLALAPRMVRGA